MACLAFMNTRNVIVSDMEIMKTGPNYTIDTVTELRSVYPDDELFLLMGTDMYLTLETWRNSEALLGQVSPAVFSRSSDDLLKIAGQAQALGERYGVNTETVVNKVIDISSSRLRDMLPRREGFGYITDTIYSYIIRNRLYGAKPDWDWMRARSYSMLKPSRIPHVAGCEAEALRLAERWGVDPDEAREAAILHDITKKLTLEENHEILAGFGITAGAPENAAEKLLHSQTGALLAKAEFGTSESIAQAILWHTTGKAEMSELEKIIYIADYIEPNRDFDGVGDLRKLAFENLNDAMIMGLEMSVNDMENRGINPNRATFEALYDLTGKQASPVL